jgi:hypothetical protein
MGHEVLEQVGIVRGGNRLSVLIGDVAEFGRSPFTLLGEGAAPVPEFVLDGMALADLAVVVGECQLGVV